MIRLFTFCLCLATAWQVQAQSDIKLFRYPALNPDGNKLAFSYQGDIWTVDAKGGAARRLTIHESYESHPQWSADGRHLLFQSNRFGNSDLFVTTPDGRRPQRLTYHSTNDEEARWGADGQIFFTTRRDFAQVEREDEIHRIDYTGGTPTRAIDAMGLMPAPSPDGRYIAFIRGNCRVVREAYQGPANRQIWLYDTKTEEYRQITTFEGQDVYPDWGPGNTLFFLSARNGRYNIYSVTINNGQAAGQPVAITDFTDEGIRYFDLSADGKTIAFERGSQLFLMNADGSGKTRRIDIDVPEDYRFDPVKSERFTNRLSGYALSNDNELVALSVRGELFVMPADKDRKRAMRQTNNPARDQEAAWLNDSTLLFISDRNGNKDLYALQSADEEETSLYRTFKRSESQLTSTPEEEVHFVLSPDRTQIAIQRGRGQLVVADIREDGKLSKERVLLDGWATPRNLTWSPDGKWLAYDMPDLDFNREIYIHAADGSNDPVNVSLHPRSDERPVWSADGSKLGFLSNRNNGDDDVWFVWLKEEDWEKTQRDWEELEAENGASNSTKKKADQEPAPVIIDFDDIHERLVQVTRLPGNEGDLMIAHDGETFYFSTNGGSRQGQAGKQAFMQINWDGSKSKTLIDNRPISRLNWDKNGKKIYFISAGRLSSLDVGKGKTEALPFQAPMEIDFPAERRQIFGEAWRAINDGFYDPGFHGKDWKKLRKRYEERAIFASTTQDFRDMFNEMLGQLNASHMGMYGSDPEDTQRDRTGLLGIGIDNTEEGVRVTQVIPGGPADREDSKLIPGDVITAVNGTSVKAGDNFYRLLNGTVNERTLLSVTDDSGEEREVVIRPSSSLRSELYDAWVDDRKALTEQYSGGRLGYIHIQGMNWPSFERFERELAASGLGKEGIIIDVRFNGGGWTTDMLMTVLNVRQHAYTIPRGAAGDLDKENAQFRNNYPFGERLPFSALTKPSIALCNENSYSNAEIFSHAYKTLNLGTLVGKPTFGAVISTGGYGLVDGSYLRMPYRAWYVKATGENMEHGPAVPDIVVDNPPASKARNQDPQLKKAVETLLEQIDAQEASMKNSAPDK